MLDHWCPKCHIGLINSVIAVHSQLQVSNTLRVQLFIHIAGESSGLSSLPNEIKWLIDLFEQNANYTFYGASDSQNCKADMAVLFPDIGCPNPPCTFNGVFMPFVEDTQLYVSSGANESLPVNFLFES